MTIEMGNSSAPAAPSAPGSAAPTPPPPSGAQPKQRLSDFKPGAPPVAKPAPAVQTAQPGQDPSIFLQPGQEAAPTPENLDANVEPDMFLEDADGPAALPPEQLYEKAQKWSTDPNLDLEAFGEKLIEVPLKNGEVEYKTVNELKADGLRQADYSRFMNELKAKDKQVVGFVAAYKDHLESVAKDPVLFAEAYEQQFGYDHMMKVATYFAEREQQDSDLILGAAHAVRDRLMAQHGINDPNDTRLLPYMQQAADTMKKRIQSERVAALNRKDEEHTRAVEQKRAQAAAEEQKIVQLSQHFEQQFKQLAPPALKSVGLNYDNPKVKSTFVGAVRALFPHYGGKITAQLVRDAATQTIEQLRAQRGRPGASSNTGHPSQVSRQAGAGGGSRGAGGGLAPQQKLSDWKPGR